MLNSGDENIVNFASARQDEVNGEESSEATSSNEWPWILTPQSAGILENAHVFAKLLKHSEATAEHLLAMLSLDQAGAAEIQKRGYSAEGAFRAAYTFLMSKPRLSHDDTQTKVVTGADLRTIVAEAEVIAKGCEALPRATATSDVVAAILERPSEDTIWQLLIGRVPLSAAEEARDGVQAIARLLAEELALLRDKAGHTHQEIDDARRRVDFVEVALARNSQKLEAVEAMATRTANDNDERWARTKWVMTTVAALVVSASVITAWDGGRALKVVVAWFSGLIA